MAKLYITRHGQTKWNEEKRLQGSKDSNLTRLGLNQAMWLSRALIDVDFDSIYSSPLGRAKTTAEILRADRSIDIKEVEDLKECNFGIWEGWKVEEIDEKFPEESDNFWNKPEFYEPIDGESFEAVEKRVLSAVDQIGKENKGNVLIVAHGIVVKILMNYFMKRGIETLWDDFVKPTSLSIVDFKDFQDYDVILYGDTSHYKK